MSEEEEDQEELPIRTQVFKVISRGILYGFILVIGYFIKNYVIRPIKFVYQIRLWLRTESDYIEDYSFRGIPPLFFEFEVDLVGAEKSELKISHDLSRSPVRIVANYHFPVDIAATLVGRSTDDPMLQPMDDIRMLKQLIETVLASAPGTHAYLDHEGEFCEFEKAKELVIEYRLYPDAVSQHNLMNGIVSLVNSLKYVNRMMEIYKDRIEDNS